MARFISLSLFWLLASALLAAPTFAAAPGAKIIAPDVPDGAAARGAWDKKASRHRVETRLYADSQSVAPGAKVRLGVLFLIDPEWHTYWRNSGEAGLPTQLTTKVAGVEGATISEMTWPAPYLFTQSSGVITTYGYANHVLHTVTVELPEVLPEGMERVEFEVRADYLTCKVECIPGDQTMTLSLPVGGVEGEVPEPVRALFDEHDVLAPVAATEVGVKVDVEVSREPIRPSDSVDALVTVWTCPEPRAIADCPRLEPDVDDMLSRALIPDLAPSLTWMVAQAEVMEDGRGLVFGLRGEAGVGKEPAATRLAGVVRLKRTSPDPRPLAVFFEEPLSSAGRDAASTVRALRDIKQVASRGAESSRPALGASAPAPEQDEEMNLLYALLLAFIGGITLNVMPCVFPVLTIKIAGIAQIAHKDRRAMIAHGLAYAAGILGAMSSMALVVIGLRFAGVQAGWGFQFQNPLFLLGLCAVLVLFAVNLFGVFDINLPGALQVGAGTEDGEGLRQSFAEGLLCVVLATPCSAPFMGTAVGFALASDAPTILAVFVSLGAGLALPFVVLCALPAWTALLPKPGPWLEKLKHLLGFSLLLTSCWLLWLIGAGYGADGMAATLVLLVTLALGAWVYGGVQYSIGGKKIAGAIIASAMIAGAGVFAVRQLEEPVVKGASESTGGVISWEEFDEQAIQDHLAKGSVVFVDFTADWCITCKVNERTVLIDEQVLEAIEARGVVMMKADWTRRDERIRAILAEYGKGGVPMYLVYSPERPERADLLPELLTPALVIEAFERASSSK